MTGNTVYFIYEQLAHLHTGNTQTKLQTYRLMKTLWKIITCLLCSVVLKYFESLLVHGQVMITNLLVRIKNPLVGILTLSQTIHGFYDPEIVAF